MEKEIMAEEYYIGQIFEGVYPPSAAIWCNKNNAYIEEIDSTEKEIVIPAETHEEVIPAEYDEEGHIIKPEEIIEVIDVPEHTETIIEDVPVEKTRTVVKTFRRYEIKAIPKPSEEEIKQARIAELKAELNSTDYVVIKIAEADTIEEQNMLREHYSDIIINRKSWRDEINELEGE